MHIAEFNSGHARRIPQSRKKTLLLSLLQYYNLQVTCIECTEIPRMAYKLCLGFITKVTSTLASYLAPISCISFSSPLSC